MAMKNNYQENSSFSHDSACRLLDVSRNGYLAWNNRNACITEADRELRIALYDIAGEFPYYGYKRMTKALQRQGYKVNHKRIYRLMSEEKLLCMPRKYKPVTTQSNHGFRKYENLAKGFIPTAINQLIVSDITYIALRSEYIYLAIIMDVFSRRFIGWGLSRDPDTQLVLRALNMAIALRGADNMAGCIHHSDQGVQYASNAYIERLHKIAMRPSMSSRGNSYDNAYAESAIKTIKYNEVHMKEYDNFEDVYANIKSFIEEVYNKKQLHSGIGYIPPEEFEKNGN